MEKNELALAYHAEGRPGKIEIRALKPCSSAEELSLAYTPGVAAPCLEIKNSPEKVYDYTSKGNLVAVISNGTAVLGLGNIGPLASKPVMEGKALLFKKFAGVDAFDLELDAKTADEVVACVKALAPSFGGINLEDIKAPECFEIERRLIEALDIPVFHDDQHGTAVIASAALLNALELSKKDIKKIKIVFSGAGAAALATAKLFLELGISKEQIFLSDLDGVVYEGRKESMDEEKAFFAQKTDKRSLKELLVGADVFVGCSAAGVLKKDFLASMAPSPIIFAMANPTPEIFPHEVYEVRKDAYVATGRSDFPNQVNNVLGFPFIFRGALDTRAKKINTAMKLAAIHALAELAKEEVPEEVSRAYGNERFSFGPHYLIPKPFDKRLLPRVATAVAKAATQTKVARKPLLDEKAYTQSLEKMIQDSSLGI